MNENMFLPVYSDHKSWHHVQSVPCEPDSIKNNLSFLNIDQLVQNQLNQALLPTISFYVE